MEVDLSGEINMNNLIEANISKPCAQDDKYLKDFVCLFNDQ